MRVSIIVPMQSYKFAYPSPMAMCDFPSGLAYVAGALRAAGHEVFGCDTNNRFGFSSAKEAAQVTIRRHLNEHQPEVVLTGGICTDFAFLRDAIATVRKWSDSVPVVLGGGIVTYDPQAIVRLLAPDFAIQGEAEHTAPRLLSAIGGGEAQLHAIPNLLWQTKEGCVASTQTDFRYPPIDSLPWPAFDVFNARETIDRYSLGARALYRYPRLNPRPWTLVAGRGCPFRCTFCVHDRPITYRTRKIENIMAELSDYWDLYRFNILVVLDELFAPNRQRLIEFCEGMLAMRRQHRGWDVAWTFQTHANAGLTRADIRLAKESGCYAFSYGMESASPAVLASMRKNSSPAQIAEVVPHCVAEGVGFGGNFIFGDPAETASTIDETMRFFGRHCETLHMSLGSIQPYPGSALYARCVANGTVPSPAQFYEQIDERRYTMAPGLPAKAFAMWCGLVGYLGGKGAWHRGAKGKVIWEERGPEFDTLLVRANCPYCGALFDGRHARVHHAAANSIGVSHLLSAVLRAVKDTRLFVLLIVAIARVAALRWLWFAHIPAMVRPGARLANCIVTGCPACNRAVRVEL